MKKILCLALCLLSFNAMAQGILSRFYDKDAEKVVFQEKGSHSFGIAGAYRSFDVAGDQAGDGYAILSLLNIGTGRLSAYNVSPKFSYFVGDDLALVGRLDYSGYTLNSDLRLDLRGAVDVSSIADNPQDEEEIRSLLNLRISSRHMVNNTWGASLSLRKYIPFFGSQTFAVFGEARLYANFGATKSCPTDLNGVQQIDKMRTTNTFSTGLKIAGGLCVRLRGSNALTISVPLVGAAYTNTRQHKAKTNNNAHLSDFKIARNLEILGLQVAYCHFIGPKNKKK